MYEEIVSKRLFFRKFRETDFDDLYEFLHNKQVCEYLPGEGVYTKEQINKWLTFFMSSFDESKPNMIYAVLEKDTTKVIGYAGYAYVSEFNRNEIMYAFHQDYWHQGYATESALEMLKIAQKYPHKTIIALADINNIGSQRVLLKVGYKQIKQIKLWGSDLYYYEMNPKEKQID